MKVVHTDAAPKAIGPYSQGIIVNNLFYSSGQIPLMPNGELLEGDVKAQTPGVSKPASGIGRGRSFFGNGSESDRFH